MKKIIFLIILLIPLTTAMQLSQTSLEFNLEQYQTACQKLNFVLDSPAVVNDTWASNPEQPWDILEFKTNAKELGLSINYPKTLAQEKEIQVCISGSKPGNYKGALIFRQEKVGSSIVQFLVWQKVSISEKSQEDDSDSHGSSRSSRRSSSSTYEYLNSNFTSSNFQELKSASPQEKIKLNKPEQPKQMSPLILLSFLPIILILLLIYLIQKTKTE